MKKLLLISLFTVLSIVVLAQNKHFVKQDGTGDGSSWANASGDLQAMIDLSRTKDTVMVAKGRYFGGFTMKNGVQVHGGFSGTNNNVHAFDSDTVLYKTILDGNAAMRVVNQPIEFTYPTRMHGFIITNGEGEEYRDTYSTSIVGAGVFLRDNGILSYCTVTRNTIGLDTGLDVFFKEGAGIYAINALIENCIISENSFIYSADQSIQTVFKGTGISAYDTEIRGCLIKNHKLNNLEYSLPSYGGGLSAMRGKIVDCIIEYNQSNLLGGGIMAENTHIENCIVRNNEIINNIDPNKETFLSTVAARGGGIWSIESAIHNCEIRNNTINATFGKGAGIHEKAVANITGSVISGNKIISSHDYQPIYPAHELDLYEVAGAGIHINDSEQYNPTGTITSEIKNCIIRDNKINCEHQYAGGAAIAQTFISSRVGVIDEYTNIPLYIRNTIIDNNTITTKNTNASKGAIILSYANYAECRITNNTLNTTDIYERGNNMFGLSQIENSIIAHNIANSTSSTHKISLFSNFGKYIKNNTIFRNNADYVVAVDENSSSLTSIHSNICYQNIISYPPTGWESINLVDTDPLFVDALNDNYRLQAGSPALGTGYVNADPSDTDIAGNPRTSMVGGIKKIDMGAYENSYTKTNIASISPLESIVVATNVTNAEIIAQFPAKMQVTTTDVQTLDLDIQWVSTPVDNSNNIQTYIGNFINIPVGIDNDNSLFATIKVNQKSASPSFTKVPLVITLADASKEYTGKHIRIGQASATGGTNPHVPTIRYLYEGIEGTNFPASYAAPIEAGKYKVTATSQETEEYYSSTMEAILRIKGDAKVTPTITLTNKSERYTGSPIEIDPAIVTGGSAPESLTVTYKYEGIEGTNYIATSQAPTAVGKYKVTASTEANSEYEIAEAEAALEINNRINQTITYPTLEEKAYGNADFNLNATVDTNFLLTYSSSDEAVATISSAGVVTIHQAGQADITVIQIGDANHNPASETQTLVVNKAEQTITLPSIGKKLLATPDFDLQASTTSNLALSYTSSDEAVATVSALGIVTIHAIGTTEITALHGGDINYNLANAYENLTVIAEGKIDQTINFPILTDKAYADANFNIVATTSSNLALVYTSSNEEVATITSEGVVTILSAGTTDITVSQAGNDDYEPASKMRTLTIKKAKQSINFPTLPVKKYGDEDFNIQATISSDLTLTYTSSNEEIATISIEGMVTIHSAGIVDLTVAQAGNDNYEPASEMQKLTIKKIKQNINFPTLANKDYGDQDFDLGASTSSNLVLTYTSSNEEVAKVSEEGMVSIYGIGTTNITASQEGDENYEAASNKTQRLTIIDNPNVIRVDFSKIAGQKGDYMLYVNNNPSNNGGYNFNATSYIWYKNNEIVGRQQSYLSSEDGKTKLDPTARYRVEARDMVSRKLVRSWEANINSGTNITIKAYPNPVGADQPLKLEVVTGDKNALTGAKVQFYNISGSFNSADTLDSSATTTAPNTPGTYIMKVNSAQMSQEIKIIVQ